jgi:hypothetical protein
MCTLRCQFCKTQIVCLTSGTASSEQKVVVQMAIKPSEANWRGGASKSRQVLWTKANSIKEPRNKTIKRVKTSVHEALKHNKWPVKSQTGPSRRHRQYRLKVSFRYNLNYASCFTVILRYLSLFFFPMTMVTKLIFVALNIYVVWICCQ